MKSKPFPKYNFTNYDAVIVAVIVLLGALVAYRFYGQSEQAGALTAVISDHGQEVERVVLSDVDGAEIVHVGQEYSLTVVVTQSGVSVSESTCPSQDCVHTGTITKSGQSIVCLPAQIVVYLESDGTENPADLIVG